MTYRDPDEVVYSGPTKKLRDQYKLLQEQLYAANMGLELRRVETNKAEEFGSKTNQDVYGGSIQEEQCY